MKNAVIITLSMITVAAIAVAAYFFGKSQTQNQAVLENIQEQNILPTIQDIQLVETSIPQKTSGTVSGKLCYPSSFIPKGKIVAKNLDSLELVMLDYPGSEAGGESTYKIDLLPGNYNLKFEAFLEQGSLNGYYTNYSACVDNPDSPDCSGQKTRPLLSVQVESGSSATNIHLCDFYYDPQNPPKF